MLQFMKASNIKDAPPLSLYKGETFVIMSLLHLIEPSFWPKQLSESLMTGLKAQK